MRTKDITVYCFIKRVYNYSIELVKPLQACSNTQDVYFLKEPVRLMYAQIDWTEYYPLSLNA